MRTTTRRLFILTAVLLLLAACKPITATPPSAADPTTESTPESTPESQPESQPESAPGTPTADLPPVVEYNLGDATIIQDQFPTDSRFHNMPVRLNGLIAVPQDPTGSDPAGSISTSSAPTGSGPFPVVVILHGTHPGCPAQGEVDTWPCAIEDEQPNYRGFAYLASELAARGYVALALNINAENTFGFGEPNANARLRQIVDLHLSALAEAAAGGVNNFGVDLAGRADVHRIALIGHSRGGESTVVLANDPTIPLGTPLAAGTPAGSTDTASGATDTPAGSTDTASGANDTPTGSTGTPAGVTYGPAAGTLLIAPAVVTFDPAGGSRVPSAIVIAGCDGDVVDGDGQFFYEAARLAPEQTASALSTYLARANHNAFNTILGRDPFGTPNRPDCATLLDPAAQRAWLVDYAAGFLATLFSPDPAVVRSATQNMGAFAFDPAPAELYGLPARVAVLPPVNNRQPLFVPASAAEFTTSPAGGTVTAEGLATTFCPQGWHSPASIPGTEPCRRVTVTVPGQPAHAVVAWEQPGGALRISLPRGVGLLNFFDALSLRVGVDPLSPLNAQAAPQSLAVQLTDGSGNTATLRTRPDEPALAFPNGTYFEDETFGPIFTGLAPLLTVRFPLRDFEGVNLMDIVEVAVLFDGQPTGALFLADVELVRSSVGFQETLDASPSPEKIAAAAAGDVEAMRQLANVYRPTEALGVTYGNLQQSVFWYRQACAAVYANAQVDFYQFARSWAETSGDEFLPEAIVCLEDAIAQGHRSAIIDGAFRAAYIDFDYPRAWYLYALLEESDPDIAAQRQSFAGQLTQAEIDEAEAAAAAWLAANKIKDYDDFFAAVNSPFRP